MGQQTHKSQNPDILVDLNHARLLPTDVHLKEINFDDLRVPMSAVKAGGVKDPGFAKAFDDGAGSTGVYSYLFDAITEEELFFAAQMPHRYKPGSDWRPHVHWFPTTTGGGVVRWGLEYVVKQITGVFGNTSLIYVDASAGVIAGTHLLSSFAHIPGTQLSESSMLYGRIFRNAGHASDTYGADAGFAELDFHFEVEKMGTVAEIPAFL